MSSASEKETRPASAENILFNLWMFLPSIHVLGIFETPVTVTPQKEVSKTLNSSKIKIPLKILNVYFWEDDGLLLGKLEDLGFWELLSLFGAGGSVGGFVDSVGRGAPWGFSKIFWKMQSSNIFEGLIF